MNLKNVGVGDYLVLISHFTDKNIKTQKEWSLLFLMKSYEFLFESGQFLIDESVLFFEYFPCPLSPKNVAPGSIIYFLSSPAEWLNALMAVVSQLLSGFLLFCLPTIHAQTFSSYLDSALTRWTKALFFILVNRDCHLYKAKSIRLSLECGSGIECLEKRKHLEKICSEGGGVMTWHFKSGECPGVWILWDGSWSACLHSSKVLLL